MALSVRPVLCDLRATTCVHCRSEQRNLVDSHGDSAKNDAAVGKNHAMYANRSYSRPFSMLHFSNKALEGK
jgi:hypothetical protein